MSSNTTHAQAAGLKRCRTIVYQQKLSRSEKGQTARQHDAYFAADVDALLQRNAAEREAAIGSALMVENAKTSSYWIEKIAERDRQIAELVAALKLIASCKSTFPGDVVSIAQTALVQTSAHDDDAVAARTIGDGPG